LVQVGYLDVAYLDVGWAIAGLPDRPGEPILARMPEKGKPMFDERLTPEHAFA